MKKLMCAIAIFVLSIACEKNKEKNNLQFEEVSLTDLKFDLVFPEELWDQILATAPATISSKKSAYELYESLLLQVELIDGTKEVLGDKNYKFDFKDFGGEIDFNTYLKRDIIGNFKMKFVFPSLGPESDFHVFYLSWSKQYKKDGEVFGNGCGVFYDVTTYFKKEVFNKGLLLHTNNYRYFDLIAGRLYFVNYTKDKIQVAQLTLTDSSLAHRMCDNRP